MNAESTLDEVKRRDSLTAPADHQFSVSPEGDRRFLLSEVDRLQSELSALKTSSGETFRLAVFHQDRANKAEAKRDAARPAIEAGIRAIQRDAVYADEVGAKWYLANQRGAELRQFENDLRGLLSLSEP